MTQSALKCPGCGFENPSGFSFCGKCGSALVGVDERITKTAIDSAPAQLKEKMLVESRKIKGERRRVVVMFADISGYTELSRDTDPEELKELVDGAILKLSEVVHRYEGYIDKIMGDCLMVLFGAPIAHEDDADRAVLAAFDLVKTIKKYGREKTARLNLSVGIARGLCYAGEYGRPGDYTVIGEDVNLAERLEKIAPPGGVYVSKGVYDLTINRINYVNEGYRNLKGVGKRRVYEAVSRRFAEKAERPFVGRKREITRLVNCFEKAKNNSGVLCFVTGERGIGKTRVYQKLKREILDYEDLFFGQARGIAYLRGEFYHVLRGVLRAILGIEEGSTTEESEVRVQSFYSERKEINYSIPFIKHLLSLPLNDAELAAIEGIDPEEREKSIEGIISSTFLHLSEERPLVIVVEDAHRMDKGSYRFFTSLQRQIREKRILIIMLSWEPVDDFLKKTPNIRLKPLSKKDTRQLLKLHFDGKPISARLLSTVMKMTKGNPLFVEETIELLKQENLIKFGRSVDLITEKIDVPDKVYNIVLARIDKLGDRAKETLKTASVAGFEFADILLSRIMGIDEVPLEVDELHDRDFIRFLRGSDYVFGQARIYAFKNEIVRDVAYELMLKEERRSLHRAAARATEKLYVKNIDEYTDIVAYHYLQAEDERAAPYLLTSAERKVKGYQLDDAIETLEKYLELKENLGLAENPQAFFDIANTYGLKANYDEAFKHLDTAESLASNDEFLGKARALKGSFLFKLGKEDEALNRMLEAEKLLSKNNDDICRNYDNAGMLYMEKGIYDKSIAYLEKSLDNRLRRLGPNHIDTGTSYNLIGATLRRQGKLDKALDCFDKALKIHISILGINHPVTAKTYIDISGLYWRRGEYDTSIEYLKKVLNIRKRVFGNNHPDTADVYGKLGTNYLYKGEKRNALSYLRKGLQIQRRIFGEVHPNVANMYFNIGGVYWKMLNFDEALEYVNHALVIWLSLFGEKHPSTLIAFNGLAILYFNLGDYDSALDYFSKVLDIRICLLGPDDPQTATSRYNLGCMYIDLGDYANALTHLAEGLRIQTRLFGNKHRETLLSTVSLGQVYLKHGEYRKAIECFTRAKDGFAETMGSRADLTKKAQLNLADAYQRIGRQGDASACRESVLSNADEGKPVVLSFISYLIDNGRLDEARKNLDRIKSNTKDRLKKLEFLQLMTRFYEASGNEPMAVECTDKALELARSIGLKPRLLDTLILAARVKKDTEIKDEALELARQIGDKSNEEEILNAHS
ncbi:tetratricopeptide repeat protein [candidate division WOR-3 bacterium]|uniref:Tetratricopeptide repeat protein n=1 Tax=candidate division WOR-3 bacterium TaxID=2052148 RepID=A0A9D5KAD1_UNCW3|nr:tetratricopeptide repeat protein [candidate division WOR-3 bacterium]MBD3365326.1 tetratricopeptide repeat protein [candidate division WOR-3 bacterium]